MAHTGDTEELESLLHRWAISAAVVRIGGREIISIGDVARPVPVHSIRKSLISALYGQAHDRGLIQLERTIGDVGIDDTPALTDTEKAATIEDLLTTRSGIYLPLPAGVTGPDRPARGAHPPGMHWHYNNWDFNVLGNIYERLTHRSLYIAFDHDLARPLGLRDWAVYEHGAYQHWIDPLGGNLRYPYYTFSLSTRDLAAFGDLYAREGRHDTAQLISADWIARSTRPIARTSFPPGFFGMYGYCWWINGPQSDLPETGPATTSFTANGFGGNYLTILPDRDVVVAITSDVSSADTDTRERLHESNYTKLLTRFVDVLGA